MSLPLLLLLLLHLLGLFIALLLLSLVVSLASSGGLHLHGALLHTEERDFFGWSTPPSLTLQRSTAVSRSFSSGKLLLATLIVGGVGMGRSHACCQVGVRGALGSEVQIRNQSSVKGGDGSDKANGKRESGRRACSASHIRQRFWFLVLF